MIFQPFILCGIYTCRVSDLIHHYTVEPIVEDNNQKLEYAVKAVRGSQKSMNDSAMKKVLQAMRQSSTGVNLIPKKANNYLITGYLFMKKGESSLTQHRRQLRGS